MNEKAQALVDALKAIGIDVCAYQADEGDDIQIEIDRTIETEVDTAWNDHFKWFLGDNKGFMILLDAKGNIKEISE